MVHLSCCGCVVIRFQTFEREHLKQSSSVIVDDGEMMGSVLVCKATVGRASSCSGLQGDSVRHCTYTRVKVSCIGSVSTTYVGPTCNLAFLEILESTEKGSKSDG
jgi:hypothetical protein